MPLHPDIAEILKARATLPPIYTLPLDEVRAGDGERYRSGLPPVEVGAVSDRVIAGAKGAIPARIYRPSGQPPFPIVVYFHGGGFAMCSIETHDEICRRICRGSKAIVVSVGYRLAPEHKFPAATDDCLESVRWIADHAEELAGDRERIAVAGDSAGGNLAAVTALRVRDEGGPRLAGQVMAYPSTDYFAQTPSRAMFASGFGFSAELMQWLRNFYLRTPEDGYNPHVSPLRAASLAGLPPALVITPEFDLLRDEGEAYARRLAAEGVRVQQTRYEGMNHGFLFWGGKLERSTAAIHEICAWLRATLAQQDR